LLATRGNFQTQLLARVRANLSFLDARLSTQEACERLAFEAGWNVVLRVPATRSDEDLALDLLQQQDVLVHPGHFYDFAQDGYLVLSLITPEQLFQEGLRRLLTHFPH
jgi:alanine-synthesizing transaminase